jgi:hypothetical protein
MNTRSFYSLIAGLALAGATCGCQSLGTVSRGQSPQVEPPAAVTQTGLETSHPVDEHIVEDMAHHLTPHTPSLHQAMEDHVQDMADKHAYDVSFYGEATQMGANGACPSGMCPQGACPSGACPGYGCPSCGMGNGLDWYPKHYGSYSYQVPNDLVYPPQNVPGGAIVYPYYTHRGPSDFFRK